MTRGQTQDKTDAQLFQVVTNGINTMPSYAPQLSREDRWKVILHVRSLQATASHDIEVSAPCASSSAAVERRRLIALAVLGAIIAAAGAVLAPDRMWASWLLVSYYALGLGLAGLCFVAIHYTTGASWSVAVRRVAEALAGTLPFASVLLAVVLVARPQLYSWTTERPRFGGRQRAGVQAVLAVPAILSGAGRGLRGHLDRVRDRDPLVLAPAGRRRRSSMDARERPPVGRRSSSSSA